jgi:hypothetical protein
MQVAFPLAVISRVDCFPRQGGVVGPRAVREVGAEDEEFAFDRSQ